MFIARFNNCESLHNVFFRAVIKIGRILLSALQGRMGFFMF